MKLAGLFSGIGGLERPFARRGIEAALLCESWEPARAVLYERFGVRPAGDIRALRRLPSGTELVTAGFPCTDLSQAGRTAGIEGAESGLVDTLFELLGRARTVECVVLENVRNMLVLDGGRAMRHLATKLGKLGYRLAYRLVDSRFTGVPQRRHRVILVACRDGDPRLVLFADDRNEPEETSRRYRGDAFGFYWTEGTGGIGWARDAVPPLKGGSGVGIPSPPAVWLADPDTPLGERVRVPSIECAERMQGFPPGWTRAAELVGRPSTRWKLVGNAVTTGVGEWIASRVLEPGEKVHRAISRTPLGRVEDVTRWPEAAYVENGSVTSMGASRWPTARRVTHLRDLIERHGSAPLSERAVKGFVERVERSRLADRKPREFLEDLREHGRFMESRAIAPRNAPAPLGQLPLRV